MAVTDDRRPTTDDRRPATRRAQRWSVVSGRWSNWLPPLLTFFLLAGLWESAVRLFGIPLYLLPAPSQIVETFLEQHVADGRDVVGQSLDPRVG